MTRTLSARYRHRNRRVPTEAETARLEEQRQAQESLQREWRAEVEVQVQAALDDYWTKLGGRPDETTSDTLLRIAQAQTKLRERTLTIYGYTPQGVLGPQNIEGTEAMRVVRERRRAAAK